MTQPETTVRLDDMPSCFEGIIPAAITTVANDGTPNITYLSVVHRVDAERVALSRQFFNKTERNTDVNPYAQVMLIDPTNGASYQLDVVYERTETDGTLFERMRTNLDAVAAHEGMTNVFRLRGTDVCRVTAARRLAGRPLDAGPRRDVQLERVNDYSRLIAEGSDMDALLATMMRACADVLGCPHAFIMLLDEAGDRLYTVASSGFPSSGAGSEVRLGEGMIGLAAARRQSVRVTHMSRDASYSHAAAGTKGGHVEQVIPLPALPAMESLLITPMLAFHQLVGVVCLQSEAPGAFQSADECVAAILSNQAAMAMATLLRDEQAAAETDAAPRAAEVKHYDEDDSIFLDNEYLIKGVAGGILWRLLRQHAETGRSEFSNKEIRLDQTLDLPDIKDNLEARLILLRKRLEDRCDYIRIEKTTRGRFSLHVARPVRLVNVAGGGPL